MQYRVELADGTVVSDNVGGEPTVYEAGGTSIISALDRALRGLRAGDRRVVTLRPADAFGLVDDGLFVETPVDQLPGDARRTGAVLMAESPDGRRQRVRVRAIRDQVAVLDFNHPPAGREVVYFVKILDVR